MEVTRVDLAGVSAVSQLLIGSLRWTFGRETVNLYRLYPILLGACIGAGALIAKSIEASLLSGAFYGLLVGVLPMAVLGVLHAGMMWWRPDLPRCKCGKTKYGEYEYIGPNEEFSEDTWYENRCPKCGRHYKSKASVVVECDANGSTIPFMKVSRWGRWEADDAEPLAGGDALDRAPAVPLGAPATFSPTEVWVAFAIEYFGEDEVLDWADAYAHDHPELDPESPLFEMLWIDRKRKDELSRVKELLNGFISRESPDFDARSKASEQLARTMFMSRLEEYLTESCCSRVVCRMIHPIEDLFDFPGWLGNMYDACDWIETSTAPVERRRLEQAIREHFNSA